MSWIEDLTDREAAKSSKFVAWAGELEFHAANEDDRVGRTARFRLVPLPEDHGKSHPFAPFHRRKGKKPGTIFTVAINALEGDLVTPRYTGDIMLLGWADGPSGATVNLLLGVDEPAHPFFGCKRPSKEGPGSRFMAAFVEKDADDTPVVAIVDSGPPAYVSVGIGDGKPIVKPAQRRSNVAAMLTKNPVFHEFLLEYEGCKPGGQMWNTESSDVFLKTACNISSKAELDVSDSRAVRMFESIRRSFVDWQEERGLLERH